MKSRIQSQACAGEYILEVRVNNRQRRNRRAQMGFRYEQVSLCRPANAVSATKYPSSLEVYAVHVKEKSESVTPGENRTQWTQYTSHPITIPQEALQAVQYYRLRWVIEDLFRTVKSGGVDYEFGELESEVALRKLFVMALMAAMHILQLR